MADIKVHELAKEYGKKPAEIIAALHELGDSYAKGNFYPIISPVEKKLRKQLGEPPKPKPEPKPETKQKIKPENKELPAKAPKNVETTPPPEESATVPKPGAGIKPPKTPDTDTLAQAIPTFAPAPVVENSVSEIPKPRISNIPTPSAIKKLRGNNPYLSGSIPRAGARPQRPGGGDNRQFRPGAKEGGLIRAGQRPPNLNRKPNQQQNAQNAQSQNAFGKPVRQNAGGFGGNRPGFGTAKPTGSGRQNQGKFVGKGQKAQTGGAFGKGKKSSYYKKAKTRHQENDLLEMPEVQGIKVPKGDGKTQIRLKQGASLVDFGEKIGTDAANLVMILFKLGEMTTATQALDEETLALLGAELGYDIQMVSEEDMDRELLEEFDINLDEEETDEENLVIRPPVVTVMGHVDHGKTRLLDAIRNTNVIEGEAGGITQRIGAYQIHIDHEGVDRKITFIDTPGHEAFTAMRARGAEITDVAILVVAADDGVMPQTVEAINHAQAAGVPIVVAVNKIDKEGADPAKVRGQLTEFGLVAEEYGGETMFVDISAKLGKGIPELLDSLLLTVDAAMELKANPNMPARGSVIEAKLDKGRGPVISVLVHTGTLRIGDPIVAGRCYGRVRAMSNESGRQLKEAYPSCPVRILGLQSVPTAGDTFLVPDDEKMARQIAEKRESAHRAALLAKRRKRMTLEDFKQAVEDGKVDIMNLIIKGDTSGSVEALEDALLKLEENAVLNGEVGLNVIHRGVGDITQNDVNLATVDSAIIIGFNVKTAGMAGDLADAEGVDIRYYNVIYKAIEDIDLSLHGMLKPEYEESITGYAEVRDLFKSSKAGTIAGCMVKGGEIKRGATARVFRGEKMLTEGLSLAGLKRFKDDAQSVKEGFECGITLDGFDEIQVDDVIETYEMVEKPRVLPKRSDSGTK